MSESVSAPRRAHALIVLRDGVATLLDECSLNGTWHNGRRVKDTVLTNGDLIGVGSVLLG